MKTINREPLLAAPSLLNAFRRGREEFGVAAKQFENAPRSAVMDAASEECLELLDDLVMRLREDGEISCQGLEEACIFLLEHLAVQLQEQTRRQELAGKEPGESRKLRLIQ